MAATEVEDPIALESNAENRNSSKRLSDSTVVDRNSPQNLVDDIDTSGAGGSSIEKCDDKDHEISRKQTQQMHDISSALKTNDTEVTAERSVESQTNSESHESPAVEESSGSLLSNETNSVIASSPTLDNAESSRPSSPEPQDSIGDVLKLDVDEPVAISSELSCLTESPCPTGNSLYPQPGEFMTADEDLSSAESGLQDSRSDDDMTCSDINQTRECILTSEVEALEHESLVTMQHRYASATEGSIFAHERSFVESSKTCESTSEDEVVAPENLADNHDSACVESEVSKSDNENSCPGTDQTTALDHHANEKHNSSKIEGFNFFEDKSPSEVEQADESTPTCEGETITPENHVEKTHDAASAESKSGKDEENAASDKSVVMLYDSASIKSEISKCDSEMHSAEMDQIRESNSKCEASVSENHTDQQRGYTPVDLDGSKSDDDNDAEIDGTHGCTSAKPEGSVLDVFKATANVDETDVATSNSAPERHSDMLCHSTPTNAAGKDMIETRESESVREHPFAMDMSISGVCSERVVHADIADPKLQKEAENAAVSDSRAPEGKRDSTDCEPVAQDLEVPKKSSMCGSMALDIQHHKESSGIVPENCRDDAGPDADVRAEENLGKRERNYEAKLDEVDSNVKFSSGKLGLGDTDKEDTGVVKMVNPSNMDDTDVIRESLDASSNVLHAGVVSSQANVLETENVEALEASSVIMNAPTEVHERVSESIVVGGAPTTQSSEGEQETTSLQSSTHTEATFSKMPGVSDTSMRSENCKRSDGPAIAAPTFGIDVTNGAEIETLQRLFDLFERDQFGCISASEIITSLRALGFNPSKSEVSRLIESRHVGDSVDFRWFSKLICEYIPERRPDVVEALKAFDNSDHKVNLADFRRIMMTQGEPLTSEECAHLLEHVQIADGGSIYFDDFVDALMHSSLRTSPAIF